ncbi:MAG: hypothetical protein Q9183_004237 [Haloplaca sp. 2 TL-2023]
MAGVLLRPLLGTFTVRAFNYTSLPFTTTIRPSTTQLPPRLVVSENDIEESFLKGSGPGGQKINKTSSAVQLKHIPTGTVVKSQATRSRSQNRSIARRLLAEKLEEAEKGPESRTALKADIRRKKKASKMKKARRKHRPQEDGGDGTDKMPEPSKVDTRPEASASDQKPEE